MAALALEKLIALGGKRFVVFGCCGALSPDLAVGDILLPTWAVSQEGTSCHYPLTAAAKASAQLHGALTDFFGRGGTVVKSGGLWTTDAPYRERWETVRQFQSQGVLAVDMEFSALVTVAAFRQVELAAVMVVSDLLYADVWEPGFSSRPYKLAIQAVGRALFEELAMGQL
jgi:uridine phosphorylase